MVRHGAVGRSLENQQKCSNRSNSEHMLIRLHNYKKHRLTIHLARQSGIHAKLCDWYKRQRQSLQIECENRTKKVSRSEKNVLNFNLMPCYQLTSICIRTIALLPVNAWVRNYHFVASVEREQKKIFRIGKSNETGRHILIRTNSQFDWILHMPTLDIIKPIK